MPRSGSPSNPKQAAQLSVAPGMDFYPEPPGTKTEEATQFFASLIDSDSDSEQVDRIQILKQIHEPVVGAAKAVFDSMR